MMPGLKIFWMIGCFDQKTRKLTDDMNKARYLLSIKWGKEDGHFYIAGHCSSANYKMMQYVILCKIDVFGVIQETECECGWLHNITQ